MTGRIFDIKRFAIHDGPGIRTTVFFKGCPLRCIWCQNPEGLSGDPGLWVKREQCLRCGLCVEGCPAGALSLEERGIVVRQELCRLCGHCVRRCPSKAIQRIDRELGLDELVEELALDRVFFEISGGGVTLSGGEPLAQPEFALALLRRLKERGIHTCIETSLFVPEDVIDNLAKVLDFLICDIKFADGEAHLKYTGQSNQIILANFKRLAQSVGHILVRLPLIPGITVEEENLKAVGSLVRSCGNIEVELLNYNWFSETKYRRLDTPHFNPGARAFSETEIDRFYAWAGLRRTAAVERAAGPESHVD